MTMVSKPGFYGGKFRKAGQHHSGSTSDDTVTEGVGEDASLDQMTKDELIAEAERRGVEIKTSDTKADIIKALEAE